MNNLHILAFYLPQYHPVKENNENFGEGFTEWTNVAKAKPLFKGHVQPKIPADLGFYDLRLPEVRSKQAELAKRAGISAFCYYHYWFGNGKIVLEKPLNEVVRIGEPDFPFCICWANHSWYKKNWNPDVNQLEKKLLFEQLYPGKQDIIDHFNYLLPIFKDKRYYKIDERLVFTIYNIGDKDKNYWDEFKSIWNNLATENGLPKFYFIAYTNKTTDIDRDVFKIFDKIVLSLLENIMFKYKFNKYNTLKIKFLKGISIFTKRPQFLYDYDKSLSYLTDSRYRDENIIPVIIPNWDYTPRRGTGGLILKNSTPELFRKHLKQIFECVKHKKSSNQIVFIKSWNEWGEGNYMEPDLQYGTAYIDIMGDEVKKYNNLEK